MANPNILDVAVRKKIIDDILGDENISRKRYEQRKFDIYRNRQAPYVIERLKDEFSEKTVSRMRKVLSINPCKRIVDQMGSIYATEPDRNFSGTAGKQDGETSTSDEALEKQLEDLYHYCKVDPALRLANRYYKLCDQAALYVVPKDGKFCVRPLTPKDYDVVPDEDDPEKAFAYVLSVFDQDTNSTARQASVNDKDQPDKYFANDQTQQTIANDSDARKNQRYVFWTKDNHLTCDGNGELAGMSTAADVDKTFKNPIGELPFIDIAIEKDFQFFVRRGNNVAEFTIDLLSQLSDLAEISRLQGWSQAIVYSADAPQDVNVGPSKVIWLKQSPDGTAPQPKFEFATPTPDLKASLEIIVTELKMFLTSLGLDPGTISGDSPQRAFTSGIDHLLANIDKFKASQEDLDLFRHVETELFDLFKKWLLVFNDVTDEQKLKDKVNVKIPDTVELEVCYAEPATVQTQTEKEDSVIKRRDAGLVTKKDAVKELYGYDDDKADEYLNELEADAVRFPPPVAPAPFGATVTPANAAQGAGVGPDGKPVVPGKKPVPGKKKPAKGQPGYDASADPANLDANSQTE